MNDRDITLLNQALELIITVIERARIEDENRGERIRDFTMYVNEKFGALRTSLTSPMGDVGERDALLQNEKKSITSTVEFTKKEISQMAETFKRAFIANGLAAHIHKRKSGKRTFLYEIRYRANGYRIIVSSTDLAEAKRKFLAKTTPNEIEKYRVGKMKTSELRFQDVLIEWLGYKKGSVLEKELQRFHRNFQIFPENVRLAPIQSIKAKDILDVMNQVKPRKYEELRTLCKGIFDYAQANGYIERSPVALVKFKKAERTPRDCLTKEEILHFFREIQNSKYDKIRQGAYLMYFCGLRPCEVDEEARREGDFLICRNRKRKNGKIEYKKIPIPKQAEEFIKWDEPLTFQATWERCLLFKELFGNGKKTSYCLRHTFSTVCQEKVAQEIVEIWVGDSPQRLIGKFYTHFSDEFMRSQMDLVVFTTPKSR